jgi:hypothetical protein
LLTEVANHSDPVPPRSTFRYARSVLLALAADARVPCNFRCLARRAAAAGGQGLRLLGLGRRLDGPERHRRVLLDHHEQRLLSPSSDANVVPYKWVGYWGQVQSTSATEITHTSQGGGYYLTEVWSPGQTTQSYQLTLTVQ